MKLKSPNLDDRNFKQLVDEAKLIIASKCPQWTDLTPGDPGIVLLELFAHLTETMIYRLNRLPEKAYVEFLRLIGVKLNPPVAASVGLRFTLSKTQDKPIEIPRGTRVTIGRAEASRRRFSGAAKRINPSGQNAGRCHCIPLRAGGGGKSERELACPVCP